MQKTAMGRRHWEPCVRQHVIPDKELWGPKALWCVCGVSGTKHNGHKGAATFSRECNDGNQQRKGGWITYSRLLSSDALQSRTLIYFSEIETWRISWNILAQSLRNLHTKACSVEHMKEHHSTRACWRSTMKKSRASLQSLLHIPPARNRPALGHIKRHIKNKHTHKPYSNAS